MPVHIRVPENIQKNVEKRAWYRFWDKERERSNHARMLHEAGAVGRRCLLGHSRIAISGPPHDAIRAYVCLDCHAAASEPEIRDKGWEFETITQEAMDAIFDLDLARQAQPQRNFYIPQGRLK